MIICADRDSAHCGYSFSCDVWSAGCVLLSLLARIDVSPFRYGLPEGRLEEVFTSILSAECAAAMQRVESAEARDLVARMLTLRPVERIWASRSLEHAWLSRGVEKAEEAPLFSRQARSSSVSRKRLPPLQQSPTSARPPTADHMKPTADRPPHGDAALTRRNSQPDALFGRSPRRSSTARPSAAPVDADVLGQTGHLDGPSRGLGRRERRQGRRDAVPLAV